MSAKSHGKRFIKNGHAVSGLASSGGSSAAVIWRLLTVF
jgi:hypothetical protein